jgi:tRNA threonylcarbamoyladenosine biosynthesis protein TsaB
VILGFDTATSATTVGLIGTDGEGIEVRDDPAEGARPNHASRLLELVEEALALAGCGWPEVQRLAAGVGPGGFTGLRIGVATARALAQAYELPVVPVSSLAALALGAQREGRLVVPVIDARRGEVFAGAYRDGRAEQTAPFVAPPERLRDWASGLEAPLAVGDGAVRYRADLEAAGVEVPPGDHPLHRISALPVCRLGAAGEPIDREALLPHYLREPDAVPRPR